MVNTSGGNGFPPEGGWTWPEREAKELRLTADPPCPEQLAELVKEPLVHLPEVGFRECPAKRDTPRQTWDTVEGLQLPAVEEFSHQSGLAWAGL